MANKGPSYGFSREVKMKLAAKYDQDMEAKQKAWILEVTGIAAEQVADVSFHDLLKDGIVLCTLADALKPGTIRKPFPHTKLLNSFRCMENIQHFLKVAEDSFNVPRSSLFQTCDLYDASNMTQVQITIQAFASAAMSQGLTNCSFAIKVADKNIRNFDERTLKAGERIIGLQMGSNKGANQSGMNFGQSRPLFDKKYTGMGEQAEEARYVAANHKGEE